MSFRICTSSENRTGNVNWILNTASASVVGLGKIFPRVSKPNNAFYDTALQASKMVLFSLTLLTLNQRVVLDVIILTCYLVDQLPQNLMRSYADPTMWLDHDTVLNFPSNTGTLGEQTNHVRSI